MNNVPHALSSSRLHALDNLRALLALLGIPFHACFLLFLIASHTVVNYLDLYPLLQHEPVSHSALFLIIFFIHLFRMPAFFLLAGFFAHFIYARSDVKKFLTNRLLRIGLPLFFIIIWLYPSYLNGVLIAAAHESLLQQQNIAPLVWSHLKNDWLQGKTWSILDNTRDAWFLNYLLWFYLITLLGLFIKSLHPLTQFKQALNHCVGQCLFTRARYILLPLILTGLMMTAHPAVWLVAYDIHLRPDLTLLTFYGVWYFLGWWLWHNHPDFSAFFNNPGYQLLSAVMTYIIYLAIYLQFAETTHLIIRVIGLFFYMLTMVLSVFGVVGLAWRYLNHAQVWLRYISASAYWVYLVQIPILLISIPLIALTHMSFWLQFIVNTVLCFFLCLSSYHLLVRYTWLRHVLGGKQ